MPSIDLLVSRFPTHELAIRRLYVRDPEFRAVCDDYGDVQRALDHWQAADQPVPGRIAQYRQMLEELEAEVVTFLSRAWIDLGHRTQRFERSAGPDEAALADRGTRNQKGDPA